MVHDPADRDILLLVIMIRGMSKFTDLVSQGNDGVDVEHGIHVLAGNRQSLKAHSGIDVFL